MYYTAAVRCGAYLRKVEDVEFTISTWLGRQSRCHSYPASFWTFGRLVTPLPRHDLTLPPRAAQLCWQPNGHSQHMPTRRQLAVETDAACRFPEFLLT